MNIYEEIDNFKYLQSDDLNNCYFMPFKSPYRFICLGYNVFLVLLYLAD